MMMIPFSSLRRPEEKKSDLQNRRYTPSFDGTVNSLPTNGLAKADELLIQAP